MKKIFLSMFMVGLFALAGTASAQVGMMGGYWQNADTAVQPAQAEQLNSTLQDIYKSQNVSGQSQLACSKITDGQFEKLGDAYMGAMAGSEQIHQAMENMMGGEGSATLKQAHINMGRSYLGCWSNYNSGPIYMPMMGGYGFTNSHNASTNYFPANGMMGGYGWGPNMMSGYWGYSGWITTVLIWILLALGIVVFIRFLRKKQ